MDSDGCVVNAVAVRELIARMGLKQWWIAEKLQVHRKTVSRWVNGSVRRTSREMAAALARVLGSTVEDITVASEAELYAGVGDQMAAAQVLRGSSLLDRLGPIGEWQSVEKLLKTALVSGLPNEVRGDLLNNLSIAFWRQDKIDLARVYAQKAREIGERTGAKSVLIPALLNLANISSWNGDIPQALRLYEACIENGTHLDPRKLAAAASNYGAVLWEAGDIAGCVSPISRAIELFSRHGRPMNLSIAHAQMAMVLMEQCDYAGAESHVRDSRKHAERDEYYRGESLSALLQAELDAALGRADAARERVRRGLERFSELGIVEGRNFEIAARAHRRAGDLIEADALVERGLPAARRFPMEAAALERERGFILISGGQTSGATRAFHRARNLYAQCGAPLRVLEMQTLSQSVGR